MAKQKTHKKRKGQRRVRVRASRANAIAVIGIAVALLIIGAQAPSVLRQGAAQEEVPVGQVAEPEVKPAPQGPGEQELKDAERHLGYQWESLEGREKELRQNFRGVAVDLGGAESILATWRGILDGMESALASADLQTFWDLNEQNSDLSWEVNDAFTALYAQQGYSSFANDLKNRERELTDIGRNLKDLQRQAKGEGGDTAPLEQLLADFQSQLGAVRSEYEALSPSDPDMQGILDDLRYRLYNELDFSVYWDLQRDLSEAVNAANTKKDAERRVKELEKALKDQEREVKNRERDGADVSELRAILDQRKSLLEEMRQLLSSPNFDQETYQDLERTLSDLDRDFWDLHSEISQASQVIEDEKNAQRVSKDKERNIKDMERECSRVKCTGEAREILLELKAIEGQMRALIAQKDLQAFWDQNGEFDYAAQDFWDSLNASRQLQDIGRWLKDITRELKDKSRFARDLAGQAKRGEIPSDVVRELEGILEELENAARRANDAYQGGKYEEANDILNGEFNELRQGFDAITFTIQERQQEKFRGEELLQMKREIDEAERHIQKLLLTGAIGPKYAELCFSFIAEGRGYVDQLLSATGIAEEVRIRFDELGRRAQRECAELFEGRVPDYTAYTKTYVAEEFQGTAEDILGRLTESLADIVVNSLTQNSSLFNTIIEQVGSRYQEQVARTLEATTYLPEDVHDDLLSRKAALLEEVSRLEDEVAELRVLAQKERDKLDAIRTQLAEHNFISDEGTRIQEKIEEFLADVPALDATETRERVAELEEIAGEAIERDAEIAYGEGLTPFTDTRIGAWYTPSAAAAKEEGFVQGTGVSGGTEFDPAGLTNVAELFTMVARIVGINPNATAGSSIGRWVPDWARPAAATLEGYNGLDLDAIFGANDPGDPVTRAQVARLIHTVFALPEGDAASFADIGLAGAAERAAIGGVKEAGIMTGQGDGTVFGVTQPLNRAELAAILTRIGDTER